MTSLSEISANLRMAGPRDGVVELFGELDLAADDAVDQACFAGNEYDVTIDLHGVTFMDCTGYGSLLRARQQLEAIGGTLTIQGARGQPRALLEAIRRCADMAEATMDTNAQTNVGDHGSCGLTADRTLGDDVADGLIAMVKQLSPEAVLTILRENRSLATTVDNLTRAVQSRDVIGQAKGIIMATTRCTADAAFTLLVEQSQHENRNLAEIADEIAARAPHPQAFARVGQGRPAHVGTAGSTQIKRGSA